MASLSVCLKWVAVYHTSLLLAASVPRSQAAPVDAADVFFNLTSHSDPSWLRQLRSDPEQEKYIPNKSSRPVRSGHYILVEPTPLPFPELLAYSKEMVAELGITEEACQGSQFAAFFGGTSSVLPAFHRKTWATPYALSIYGQEMYSNCPFGTGDGYGDGRAISVAEVLLDTGQRWELQLKGAGKTPFSRSGDGRAVLRSSLREFLASEAMFHLGVSTTRALSLVISRIEHVRRPWYSNNLSHWDNAFPRRVLRRSLVDHMRDPDQLITEPAAITTRVSSSFIRVGHLELYGRRVAGPKAVPEGPLRHVAMQDLQDMVHHTIFREFPDCLSGPEDLQSKVLCFLDQSSMLIANMTAEWIRVGFCQGNFNSDNCHVAGRTIDYGPFGFIQRFEPLWNMWQDGGDHFGFLNQPVAGTKNFGSLVAAVLPLLDPNGVEVAQQLLEMHSIRAQTAVNDVWRRKLGLAVWDDYADSLLGRCLVLMEGAQADYTLFWRQLAELPLAGYTGAEPANVLILPLSDVFYKPLSQRMRKQLVEWVQDWLKLLIAQDLSDGVAVARAMQRTSPKYIPREWMLVDAYTKGNKAAIEELLDLFRDPYAITSQPDFEARFYRKAPVETYMDFGIGGVSYMSCSS